jgi:hypothetical protein
MDREFDFGRLSRNHGGRVAGSARDGPSLPPPPGDAPAPRTGKG